MSKALEYTTQIIIARVSNSTIKEYPKDIATSFEVIYNKISELEKKEEESAS